MNVRLLTIYNTNIDEGQVIQHQGSENTDHIDVAISTFARVFKLKWKIVLSMQNISSSFATDHRHQFSLYGQSVISMRNEPKMYDQQWNIMRLGDPSFAGA